ncbi:MAG: hypothetical protein KBD37_04295 [Burkholderiales bacterium]|nr:hypothetical protein [Burkholderiales bacterium]
MFSQIAIRYLKKHIKKNSINNTSLWCLEAIETHKIDKKYKMVILNSVVQYFPNVEYLVEVINQCIDRLLQNGHVYIGDVRSLCHLREFHASVLLNKSHYIENQDDFQGILEYVINEDNELVIDHNFFYYMKTINPKISHVQILLKEGAFHNEMNCFRYNVILHINHESVPQSNLGWHEWNINKTNLSYLREKLERRVDYIAIKNIPNQRLFGLSEILCKKIRNKLGLKAAYKKIMLQSQLHSIDPYIISQLSKEYGYQAMYTWSRNPSYFGCIIKKYELKISFDDCYDIKRINRRLINPHNFTNHPLVSKAKKIVAKDIKDYLKSILPSYMVPQHFLIMSSIPITSNGKIDIKSLSQIADLASNNSPVILPRSTTEKKIVAIWQEILEIKKIGVTQKFNELGGTSLLTLQLLSKINQQFKINLELTNIEYGNITVRSLAQHIESVK